MEGTPLATDASELMEEAVILKAGEQPKRYFVTSAGQTPVPEAQEEQPRMNEDESKLHEGEKRELAGTQDLENGDEDSGNVLLSDKKNDQSMGTSKPQDEPSDKLKDTKKDKKKDKKMKKEKKERKKGKGQEQDKETKRALPDNSKETGTKDLNPDQKEDEAKIEFVGQPVQITELQQADLLKLIANIKAAQATQAAAVAEGASEAKKEGDSLGMTEKEIQTNPVQCSVCKKPSVDKCEFFSSVFTGCGAPFCATHGVPSLQAMAEMTLSEEDSQKLFSKRIDLLQEKIDLAKDDLASVRFCKKCQDKACRSLRPRGLENTMAQVLILAITLVALLIGLIQYQAYDPLAALASPPYYRVPCNRDPDTGNCRCQKYSYYNSAEDGCFRDFCDFQKEFIGIDGHCKSSAYSESSYRVYMRCPFFSRYQVTERICMEHSCQHMGPTYFLREDGECKECPKYTRALESGLGCTTDEEFCDWNKYWDHDDLECKTCSSGPFVDKYRQWQCLTKEGAPRVQGEKCNPELRYFSDKLECGMTCLLYTWEDMEKKEVEQCSIPFCGPLNIVTKKGYCKLCPPGQVPDHNATYCQPDVGIE